MSPFVVVLMVLVTILFALMSFAHLLSNWSHPEKLLPRTKTKTV